MKKHLFILLTILLVTACEYGEKIAVEREDVYYPSEDHFITDYEIVEIDLHSVENYAQLYVKMEKNACENKTSVVKFPHGDKDYNIAGFVECPDLAITNCFFRVNHINISGDSLVYEYDTKLPVENLDDALNDLMSNPYNYKYQSTSLKSAIIWFHGDKDQPVGETRELLIRITEEFDKINKLEKGKFPYYINFLPYKYKKIPPPPPPPLDPV